MVRRWSSVRAGCYGHGKVDVQAEDGLQRRVEEGRRYDGGTTAAIRPPDGQAAVGRCDGRQERVKRVAGVGQWPRLAQARRLGRRLGPGVPVCRHCRRTSANDEDRCPSAVAAAVRQARDGRRQPHGPRHDQRRPRIPAVLHQSGQVVRRPVRRIGRRAQRQTQRRVPGRRQSMAAAQLKDYLNTAAATLCSVLHYVLFTFPLLTT